MPTDLPPMLAAPSPATFRRMEEERRQANRQATLARKAEYRKAMLRWMAAALENPDAVPPQPAGAQFDLTPESAASARRDLARVLRHRADEHDGRLRV